MAGGTAATSPSLPNDPTDPLWNGPELPKWKRCYARWCGCLLPPERPKKTSMGPRYRHDRIKARLLKLERARPILEDIVISPLMDVAMYTGPDGVVNYPEVCLYARAAVCGGCATFPS